MFEDIQKTESKFGRRLFMGTLLFIGAFLLPGIILGGRGFLIGIVDRTRPSVALEGSVSGIGLEPTTLVFDVVDKGSGLKEVYIRSKQGGNIQELVRRNYLDDEYPKNKIVTQDSIEISFDGKESGYLEGELNLLVSVVDRSIWKNYRVDSLSLLVDYESPKIKYVARYISGHLGGAGIVFYRLLDRSVEFSGIKMGSGLYPGFLASRWDSAFIDEDDLFVVFFPLSNDCFTSKCSPQVLAIDAVNNQASVPLSIRFLNDVRPSRVVDLQGVKLGLRIDRFYNAYLKRTKATHDVSLQIEAEEERMVYRFQKVNRDYREILEEDLLSLFKNPKSSRYWNGVFQGYHGVRVSRYGENLKFKLNGVEAGERLSTGCTWREPKDKRIRAANKGVVIFADEFGLYGRTIIVDHGFGLASLYGHMGKLERREGDLVKKGAVIGSVGSTGLAGSVQFHYELLLHGVPIDPEPWWDHKRFPAGLDRTVNSLKKRLGISRKLLDLR